MRYAILLFLVTATATAAEPPVRVGVIGLDAHALAWAKILRDRGPDAPYPELADITIVAAVIAQVRFGDQLANVDPLHGGAESFLTISNLLVLLGFAGVGSVRQGGAGGMNKS